MNALVPLTDRRFPHRADRAEELAEFFHHPDAIADDPLHERARLAAYRFWKGEDMGRDDWTALKVEATLWAGPVGVIPEF